MKTVAAIGLIMLAAIGLGAGTALLQGGREPQAQPAASAGMSHVHGLGLNPADGSLVVATHSGSFRLAAGSDPTRIGDSYQDTMGFTVVGADHFLGSGHPDVAGMQAGMPGRLGLIESTDAGATWDVRSLGGEADLHALAVAGDGVYAWDAGKANLLHTTDRTTWEVRSTVELSSFAVDPEDDEHLVAAAAEDTIESVDGGRTWAPAGAPPLLLVDWGDDQGLWGADATGKVWRRTGADGEWTSTGAVRGTPQALLVTDDAVVLAYGDAARGGTSIARSPDGVAWETIYEGD